jgi:hypothetical protein
MQITVTIPDEFAAEVRAQGSTPERFVESLVNDAARETSSQRDRRANPLKVQLLIEGLARHSEKIPQLPDAAFSRESFYNDHD